MNPAGKRMKVLAADDNPISQTVLRSMLLKWGYDVVTASDGDQAWQVLHSPQAPSLAILDWMMPGQDGVEICRRLRAAGKEPYTYVLLLTSRSDCQDLVEALDAGADDYLTKPFNSSELRARLRAGRRIIELQEQLLAAQEELRMRATHDGLTGLLNRFAIMEILRRELARCSRENQPISILMADLDKFKHVNDSLGHLAGDAVLRESAARMQASFRCTTPSAATAARNSWWCCPFATKARCGTWESVFGSSSPRHRLRSARACWQSRAASAAQPSLVASRTMPIQ
jgi:PleD family two-component response regulator